MFRETQDRHWALRSNIQHLQQKGALRTSRFPVPDLIRDTIELTYSLRIRYLWVDALCTVQDGEYKHEMFASMDSVYHRAYLTIIALDSNSAEDCLPGIRRLSRPRIHQKIRINTDYFPVITDVVRYLTDDSLDKLTIQITESAALLVAPSPYSKTIMERIGAAFFWDDDGQGNDYDVFADLETTFVILG
ncbi:hypothetical protein K458DRAFT_414058 [Lentithecium fluviatile CBS 122367]|uniref:Heterokaryon incompatibility domain-containing protein n=1 Tax=Lentithecium fluviatile CBS 122367 TaxID=1168545 RepID=A0A6G1JDS2_9PLEO|nr:hypothetical protein K458DRAFT_414058 [Lentithecium fluviatile CBS 122367]